MSRSFDLTRRRRPPPRSPRRRPPAFARRPRWPQSACAATSTATRASARPRANQPTSRRGHPELRRLRHWMIIPSSCQVPPLDRSTYSPLSESRPRGRTGVAREGANCATPCRGPNVLAPHTRKRNAVCIPLNNRSPLIDKKVAIDNVDSTAGDQPTPRGDDSVSRRRCEGSLSGGNYYEDVARAATRVCQRLPVRG